MDLFRPGPGTEAANARSAVGLRLLLSGMALPLSVLGALWAAVAAAEEPGYRDGFVAVAVVLALVALVAAIDIVVLLRRRRRNPR